MAKSKKQRGRTNTVHQGIAASAVVAIPFIWASVFPSVAVAAVVGLSAPVLFHLVVCRRWPRAFGRRRLLALAIVALYLLRYGSVYMVLAGQPAGLWTTLASSATADVVLMSFASTLRGLKL